MDTRSMPETVAVLPMDTSFTGNIAFTVCSNNYLAQAKTLEDSLRSTNPEFRFFIMLADVKADEFDYSIFEHSCLIEVSESVVPGYRNMISRYSIVELNTAIKPFIFQFLLKQYPLCYAVYYFDPDMYIYTRLDYLDNFFLGSDILLTPHFITPVPDDDLNPTESMALNYGIYNLGFIGVKRSGLDVASFLDWWGRRTFRFGYFNTCDGYFVDQLWINLTTIFFKHVGVLLHPGCNMGPWNIYERRIVAFNQDREPVLENQEPLIFYHFSSFDYKNPGKTLIDYNRVNIEKTTHLLQLYTRYGAEVNKNKIGYYKNISCRLPLVTTNPPLKSRILGPVINAAKRLWKNI